MAELLEADAIAKRQQAYALDPSLKRKNQFAEDLPMLSKADAKATTKAKAAAKTAAKKPATKTKAKTTA